MCNSTTVILKASTSACVGDCVEGKDLNQKTIYVNYNYKELIQLLYNDFEMSSMHQLDNSSHGPVQIVEVSF